MQVQKVYAVYFSPTHGTKGYVEEIAQRMSGHFEVIDLTNPAVREKDYTFSENDLVIFGAPVYAGRLPFVRGVFLSVCMEIIHRQYSMSVMETESLMMLF